jgi:hypothetical protein
VTMGPEGGGDDGRHKRQLAVILGKRDDERHRRQLARTGWCVRDGNDNTTGEGEIK